jgi:hypothetical protein
MSDDEITPEMAEAGASVLLLDFLSGSEEDRREVARRVYDAMRAEAFVICPVCEDNRG